MPSRALQSLVAVCVLLCACGGDEPEPRAPHAGGHWVSAPDAPSALPPKPSGPLPVPLASCGQTAEGFEGWLVSFGRDAIARGVSTKTVESALRDLAYDPEVIELDRNQSAFQASFAEFYASHVTSKRLARAKERRDALAATLQKIEERFGVPGEILVAIWGLETDFGDNVGTRSSFRSLATLAWDCRRSQRFRDELGSALRIVERGDLSPFDMVGAWAGEIGQTQFMPSSYEKYAIDFDGDGRADLLGSSADALASTASFLKGSGWRAGEGYGPGSPNFEALGAWNASDLWRKTIAAFAKKLAKKAAKKP